MAPTTADFAKEWNGMDAEESKNPTSNYTTYYAKNEVYYTSLAISFS